MANANIPAAAVAASAESCKPEFLVWVPLLDGAPLLALSVPLKSRSVEVTAFTYPFLLAQKLANSAYIAAQTTTHPEQHLVAALRDQGLLQGKIVPRGWASNSARYLLWNPIFRRAATQLASMPFRIEAHEADDVVEELSLLITALKLELEALGGLKAAGGA